jgi:GntR family transcriptional regulator
MIREMERNGLMPNDSRLVNYRELARSLRQGIENGDYDASLRLPTEAELAALHGLSRQTVRRAMQELVTDGLVYRVPGRGTFATDKSERYLRHFGSIEDFMGLSLATETEIVEPLSRKVDLAAAGRLRLGTDSVWRVVFVQRLDGAPVCLTELSLPPDIGEMVRDVEELTTPGPHGPVTIIGLLEKRSEITIREVEQSVTAVPAPPYVAQRLGCSPDVPMLRIDRTWLDGNGRPIELGVGHFDPQKYSYRIRLRRRET